MANHVYPKYLKAAASGGANVNYLAGTVKLVLLDTGTYTYNDADEFLSDIPSGARVSISGALTGKSISDLGAVICANSRFDAVTGVSVEAIAVFFDTGAPATSRLMGYIDTGITGLPVTPAGGSYNVIVDTAGLFVL